MNEQQRLNDNYSGKKDWLKWGPYLSERQWGTVREDYSANGDAWNFFPHDHARSRVYRWGEDGIAGITDRYNHINFCIGLWNGKDEIIKERLFGLTGPQGNHAEDVKELYYYLDNNPTHSYMKHLYKYPQAAFPYQELLERNQNLGKEDNEFELLDTGLFNDDKYFDVFTEYAKADEEDLLIKITVHNRSSEKAPIQLVPKLWLTNKWEYGLIDERPSIKLVENKKDYGTVQISYPHFGDYYFYFEQADKTLFCDNETNNERLFNSPNKTDRPKDAINDAVVNKDYSVFENVKEGTIFSPSFEREIEGGQSITIKLRLSKKAIKKQALGNDFDSVFEERIQETNEFYSEFYTANESEDRIQIQRQAYAGMLWTKQYYYYDVPVWLNGDEGHPSPPEARKKGRNASWTSLNNQDIISMPDKWEYPWYAAWDSAFHVVPLARLDAQFAKDQMILFLREWYMKPNGQLPAYEWSFSDVNPPVHAWGCLQIYHLEKKKTGKGDIDFLKRVFQKLLINFTWWVNRKDRNDNNIFEGGFLGLDNIGVFDRSAAVPGGGVLEQVDGTSWMAMYSLNMLEMALEIAEQDPVGYEDTATKFLEHFVYIGEALNKLSENFEGLWDEQDGFFYDMLTKPNGEFVPIKVRSLVGLSTLFASLVVKKSTLDQLPEFYERLKWFKANQTKNLKHLVLETRNEDDDMLLSLVPKDRLKRILDALLSKDEFFSDYGIRSLSKIHENPYSVEINGQHFGLQYEEAESRTNIFGGNSNWRGPIWFPMNYLLVESLKTLDFFFADELTMNNPNGGENIERLSEVANEVSLNLIKIFEKDENGNRRVHALNEDIYQKEHFKDLVLFYEYFHGDNGRGIGASHQTGWTGLVAELIANQKK